MKDFFSPGSLVTIAGGVLTVVGATAYATGSANLSLPTIFYGIPDPVGRTGPEIVGTATRHPGDTNQDLPKRT